MIKYIFLALLLVSTVVAYGQYGNSPYSLKGIGELAPGNAMHIQFMQNINTYRDSIHPNIANPASYSDLKMVNYVGGISYNSLHFKSLETSPNSKTMNFEYINLAFPLSKNSGFGIGIKPYTIMKYAHTFVYKSTDINTNVSRNVENTVIGKGGINQFYASFGKKFFKKLSLGITWNYNFGSIDIKDTSNIEGVELSTSHNTKSRITGSGYSIGINYDAKFKNKYELYFSGVFNGQKTLNVNNFETRSLLSSDPSAMDIIRKIDTLDLKNDKNTKLIMPFSTSVGVGIGERNKWFLAFEVEHTNFKNTYQFGQNIENNYQNTQVYRIGGVWTPKYNSYDYFDRISYYFGVSYGDIATKQDVTKFGTSIGFGLPIGMYSKINIGAIYTRRGNNSLIKEDYIGIKIGLSFNNIWFIRRKFN